MRAGVWLAAGHGGGWARVTCPEGGRASHLLIESRDENRGSWAARVFRNDLRPRRSSRMAAE
jgi:hypothetical protein